MKKRGYLYIPKTEKPKSAKVITKPAEKPDRIVGLDEPDKITDTEPSEFQEGQRVDLLIGDETDLGYNALINSSCEGLLYKNEVFQPLRKGDHISGFIKKMREDGKIDLSLQKPGAGKVYDVADKILGKLKDEGGFIALNDKTRPEEIYRLFRTSKKTYKKAIGALYKKRLILIENDGIRLARKTVHKK